MRQFRSISLVVAALSAVSSCTFVGGGSDTDVLDRQAAMFERQGKSHEAAATRKQALDLYETRLDPNSPLLADALWHTGGNYVYEAGPMQLYQHQIEQARALLTQADQMLTRALAIYEKNFSPDDVHIAAAARSLGQVRILTGRFGDARELYARAIAIYEKREGPNAPTIADMLLESEWLYHGPEKHDAYVQMLKRAVTIREAANGPDGQRTADALERLGYFYMTYSKRYDLAEPLAKRVLDIREKSGPNSGGTVSALVGLAAVYAAQRRFDEAEGLYKRAATIQESLIGPDQVDVALNLNMLANMYYGNGRLSEAKDIYLRIQPIFERRLGSNDSNVASNLTSIAGVERRQGNFAQAKALLDRARAMRKLNNPPEGDFDVTNEYDFEMDYAFLYLNEGRYSDSEKSLRAARPSLEKETGALDPHRIIFHYIQARIYDGQDRQAEAMGEIRRALLIAGDRAKHLVGGRSSGMASERQEWRDYFYYTVDLGERLGVKVPPQRPTLTAETFEVAQYAETSSTEQAVANMAARSASSSDALANVVRARQDAQQEWRIIDDYLALAARESRNKRDLPGEEGMRRKLLALDQQLDAFDTRLARDFPQYTEIANPKPVPLAVAQKLLGHDEALLTYLVGDKESFLWVVRPSGGTLLRLSIGRKALDEVVGGLRGGLDPTLAKVTTVQNIPAFDVGAANALYQKIFAPAEPLLAGVRTLFVVPDGALQSVPLSVLVTQKPVTSIKDPTAYKSVPWLARRYAVTILPATSSLRALRTFAKAGHAAEPFVGYGDPNFRGESGDTRGVKIAKIFRGGQVNTTELRDLPRLPETAGELRAQAQALHSEPSSVHLGAEATVTAVKQANLSDTRVIAFATHGLVAGDLPALAEPALALSPPATPTPEDNGLLLASDVSQLKLNADWVVLSACNTAAPDGGHGAEGLSGLAKAFFYAGARSLLVSHWPVDSASAVKLTTGAFRELASDESLGRAEALRRSMISMIDQAVVDPNTAYQAHPMFWAPFVVVGEGGSGR